MKTGAVIFVVVCVVLAFFAVGCESSKAETAMVPEISYSILTGKDVADVTAEAEFGSERFSNGLYEDYGYYEGIKDIVIEVVNKSEANLQINWEKSRIYYAGTKSKVNYLGQGKYGRNYDIPNTLVRIGTRHQFTIFPENLLKINIPAAGEGDDINITFGSHVIPTTEVDVVLCLEYGNQESEYSIHIEPQRGLSDEV